MHSRIETFIALLYIDFVQVTSNIHMLIGEMEKREKKNLILLFLIYQQIQILTRESG